MKKPARIYLKSFAGSQKLQGLDICPHDPFHQKKVEELRKYTQVQKLIKNKKTDFTRALKIAEFVSKSWQHDGFQSSPPKADALTLLKLARKGHNFACVQFASVFMQLCHSVGIPARVLSVSAKGVEFGSSGNGHVTAEYYDNDLQKWIWIDPQIHAYAVHKKQPVGYCELVMEGNKSWLRFTARTKEYMKGRSNHNVLKDFIFRYQGSVAIGGWRAFFTKKDSAERLGWLGPRVLPPITFQGFAVPATKYVSREDFNAKINGCSMSIQTLEPVAKVNWKSLEDYKANNYKNFARSEITIHLENNMPWFNHYEVSINGKKQKIYTDKFSTRLKTGSNIITCRPVNQAGRMGHFTQAKIQFDNRYPVVRNYW